MSYLINVKRRGRNRNCAKKGKTVIFVFFFKLSRPENDSLCYFEMIMNKRI